MNFTETVWYENEGPEENGGKRQNPSTNKGEFAFSERDSRIIRHLIVVTLFVAMFLVMYPFLTLGLYSFVSGRNLDRRKLMAAGAAVYLAVLAACGCVLMGAPRGHLSPTERDFIIAVAISANIYALLSMTRLCRVIFSGAGAGGSSRVGTITGDGRTDAQNDLPSYDDAISSPAYTRPLFIQDADDETCISCR